MPPEPDFQVQRGRMVLAGETPFTVGLPGASVSTITVMLALWVLPAPSLAERVMSLGPCFVKVSVRPVAWASLSTVQLTGMVSLFT